MHDMYDNNNIILLLFLRLDGWLICEADRERLTAGLKGYIIILDHCVEGGRGYLEMRL